MIGIGFDRKECGLARQAPFVELFEFAGVPRLFQVQKA